MNCCLSYKECWTDAWMHRFKIGQMQTITKFLRHCSSIALLQEALYKYCLHERVKLENATPGKPQEKEVSLMLTVANNE